MIRYERQRSPYFCCVTFRLSQVCLSAMRPENTSNAALKLVRDRMSDVTSVVPVKHASDVFFGSEKDLPPETKTLYTLCIGLHQELWLVYRELKTGADYFYNLRQHEEGIDHPERLCAMELNEKQEAMYVRLK